MGSIDTVREEALISFRPLSYFPPPGGVNPTWGAADSPPVAAALVSAINVAEGRKIVVQRPFGTR